METLGDFCDVCRSRVARVAGVLPLVPCRRDHNLCDACITDEAKWRNWEGCGACDDLAAQMRSQRLTRSEGASPAMTPAPSSDGPSPAPMSSSSGFSEASGSSGSSGPSESSPLLGGDGGQQPVGFGQRAKSCLSWFLDKLRFFILRYHERIVGYFAPALALSMLFYWLVVDNLHGPHWGWLTVPVLVTAALGRCYWAMMRMGVEERFRFESPRHRWTEALLWACVAAGWAMGAAIHYHVVIHGYTTRSFVAFSVVFVIAELFCRNFVEAEDFRRPLII